MQFPPDEAELYVSIRYTFVLRINTTCSQIYGASNSFIENVKKTIFYENETKIRLHFEWSVCAERVALSFLWLM